MMMTILPDNDDDSNDKCIVTERGQLDSGSWVWYDNDACHFNSDENDDDNFAWR